MRVAVGVKKALSLPCAARMTSQHSRTAPEPPGTDATQCATCDIYAGALGTLAAKPTRCRAVRSMMSSPRSEEHTSELQSLMRISYAVFCFKNKHTKEPTNNESDMI